MSRAGLKKVRKTVRGAHGMVQRSYWTKADSVPAPRARNGGLWSRVTSPFRRLSQKEFNERYLPKERGMVGMSRTEFNRRYFPRKHRAA